LSVDTPTPSAARNRGVVDADSGGGWLTFAGILLLIVGVMNVIGGIGAIDDSKFFAGNTKYVWEASRSSPRSGCSRATRWRGSSAWRSRA
jgi:hypothetical protein